MIIVTVFIRSQEKARKNSVSKRLPVFSQHILSGQKLKLSHEDKRINNEDFRIVGVTGKSRCNQPWSRKKKQKKHFCNSWESVPGQAGCSYLMPTEKWKSASGCQRSGQHHVWCQTSMIYSWISRDVRYDLEPFQNTTLTKRALDPRPNKQTKLFQNVFTLLQLISRYCFFILTYIYSAQTQYTVTLQSWDSHFGHNSNLTVVLVNN